MESSDQWLHNKIAASVNFVLLPNQENNIKVINYRHYKQDQRNVSCYLLNVPSAFIFSSSGSPELCNPHLCMQYWPTLRLFWIPKNYLPNFSQKITCQIFLPQNKMEKNKTPRKYFNHSHQFNSGVPPSIIFKINK